MKPLVKVFIFRRDMRIVDNTALLNLNSFDSHIPIIPIFIFNPYQINKADNRYYNINAIEFMIECLKELKSHCPSLLYLHGNDIDILNNILKAFRFHAISWNSDITPFARERDIKIMDWCKSKDIPCILSEDYTLFPMNSIVTLNNKPYEMFTPFYNKCISKLSNISYNTNKKTNISFYTGSIKGIDVVKHIDRYHNEEFNPHLHVHGGRSNALELLYNIEKTQYNDYDTFRDYPSLNKTTGLSPYLKFGCISIREVYEFVRKHFNIKHPLIRELLWKEFYAHITYQYPKILQGQINTLLRNDTFKNKYANIQLSSWYDSKEYWDSWCEGKTGYPIIDAGMRQMNKTGWMHNRVRMISAMFLVKDLLIDWRDGERYFAKKLLDYDPSSNNGGWQWCASTGTDSQPYFRIFNPILQTQKFDKNCVYIKKWIPELHNIPCKDILIWDKSYYKYPECKYPKPIVNHKIQTEKALHIFSNVNEM